MPMQLRPRWSAIRACFGALVMLAAAGSMFSAVAHSAANLASRQDRVVNSDIPVLPPGLQPSTAANDSPRRFWHNSTAKPMWTWDYKYLNETGGTLFYPSELGYDAETNNCSRDYYTHMFCRIEDPMFQPPEPSVCRGQRRVPLFEFSPPREKFTIVDAALRLGKPNVTITLIGDSGQYTIWHLAACQLSKIPQARIVASDYFTASHSASPNKLTYFPSVTARISHRGETVTLRLNYVRQNKAGFDEANGTAQAICARSDLFVFSWGPWHANPPGKPDSKNPDLGEVLKPQYHALYIAEMRATLRELRDCHVLNQTVLAFQGNGDPSSCGPIRASIEESDFRTYLLRQHVLPFVGLSLVPPPYDTSEPGTRWGSVPSAELLHYLPWFDLVFHVPVEFHLNRMRKSKPVVAYDCFHWVEFPSIAEGVIDSMFWAVHRERPATADYGAQALRPLFKPDVFPAGSAEFGLAMHNFAMLGKRRKKSFQVLRLLNESINDM